MSTVLCTAPAAAPVQTLTSMTVQLPDNLGILSVTRCLPVHTSSADRYYHVTWPAVFLASVVGLCKSCMYRLNHLGHSFSACILPLSLWQPAELIMTPLSVGTCVAISASFTFTQSCEPHPNTSTSACSHHHRDPQRVCAPCASLLAPLQPFLAGLLSHAVQPPVQDAVDSIALRSWVNPPWSAAMGQELFKATNMLHTFGGVRHWRRHFVLAYPELMLSFITRFTHPVWQRLIASASATLCTAAPSATADAL